MDLEKYLQTVTTTIAALLAILAYLKSRRMERAENKKLNTEGDKNIAETAQNLINISQDLLKAVQEKMIKEQERNEELTKRLELVDITSKSLEMSIHELKIDNQKVFHVSRQLMNGIGLLLTQLTRLGIEPIWTPPQELLDTMDRRIRSDKYQK